MPTQVGEIYVEFIYIKEQRTRSFGVWLRNMAQSVEMPTQVGEIIVEFKD